MALISHFIYNKEHTMDDLFERVEDIYTPSEDWFTRMLYSLQAFKVDYLLRFLEGDLSKVVDEIGESVEDKIERGFTQWVTPTADESSIEGIVMRFVSGENLNKDIDESKDILLIYRPILAEESKQTGESRVYSGGILTITMDPFKPGTTDETLREYRDLGFALHSLGFRPVTDHELHEMHDPQSRSKNHSLYKGSTLDKLIKSKGADKSGPGNLTPDDVYLDFRDVLPLNTIFRGDDITGPLNIPHALSVFEDENLVRDLIEDNKKVVIETKLDTIKTIFIEHTELLNLLEPYVRYIKVIKKHPRKDRLITEKVNYILDTAQHLISDPKMHSDFLTFVRDGIDLAQEENLDVYRTLDHIFMGALVSDKGASGKFLRSNHVNGHSNFLEELNKYGTQSLNRNLMTRTSKLLFKNVKRIGLDQLHQSRYSDEGTLRALLNISKKIRDHSWHSGDPKTHYTDNEYFLEHNNSIDLAKITRLMLRYGSFEKYLRSNDGEKAHNLMNELGKLGFNTNFFQSDEKSKNLMSRGDSSIHTWKEAYDDLTFRIKQGEYDLLFLGMVEHIRFTEEFYIDFYLSNKDPDKIESVAEIERTRSSKIFELITPELLSLRQKSGQEYLDHLFYGKSGKYVPDFVRKKYSESKEVTLPDSQVTEHEESRLKAYWEKHDPNRLELYDRLAKDKTNALLDLLPDHFKTLREKDPIKYLKRLITDVGSFEVDQISAIHLTNRLGEIILNLCEALPCDPEAYGIQIEEGDYEYQDTRNSILVIEKEEGDQESPVEKSQFNRHFTQQFYDKVDEKLKDTNKLKERVQKLRTQLETGDIPTGGKIYSRVWHRIPEDFSEKAIMECCVCFGGDHEETTFRGIYNPGYVHINHFIEGADQHLGFSILKAARVKEEGEMKNALLAISPYEGNKTLSVALGNDKQTGKYVLDTLAKAANDAGAEYLLVEDMDVKIRDKNGNPVRVKDGKAVKKICNLLGGNTGINNLYGALNESTLEEALEKLDEYALGKIKEAFTKVIKCGEEGYEKGHDLVYPYLNYGGSVPRTFRSEILEKLKKNQKYKDIVEHTDVEIEQIKGDNELIEHQFGRNEDGSQKYHFSVQNRKLVWEDIKQDIQHMSVGEVIRKYAQAYSPQNEGLRTVYKIKVEEFMEQRRTDEGKGRNGKKGEQRYIDPFELAA